MKCYHTSPTNLTELWTALANIWQVNPVERFQKLVKSMPRRVAAFVKDKRSEGNGCAIQHDFMLLTVSLTSIENLRNNFANIKEEAIGLAKKWGITPEFEKQRNRKVRQFFDDFNADENCKTEKDCLSWMFLSPMLMLLQLN
ncbi:hypothetical protein TNCV_651171 [Trichonephila clavipes]|nr:hypothetical protein TNCV_651171 [Trichonephila clavipes]